LPTSALRIVNVNSSVLKSSLLTPAGRKVAEAVCLEKHVGIERLFNLLGEMQEQLQQLRDNSAAIKP
jgi:hypothetical protein